jgi:CRISPR system Cascade subunit CasA
MKMNLITEPWIPVILEDGTSALVGLEQLYQEAETIRDLNANPPQRIALMRLLLCISQAALDGPEDEDDWKTCRDRIIPASLDYLAARHDKFNLYGDKPFLQIQDLSAKKYSTLDKMMETSIGENPMFLGSRAQDGRVVSPAEKILALLVFLNFSAGGRVGQAVWAETQYSDPTFATPCFGRLFLFIRGADMLETLWLNILPAQNAGKAVWDKMPSGPQDAEFFKNAYETSLGRMVPLTRLIRLPEDEKAADCVIGPVPKNHVFSNEPGLFREPYCTLKLSKDNNHYYMPVDVSKHSWRELGSVLALKTTHENFSALNLANPLHAEKSIIDIWCGGLAKGATAAKIYDMADWNFSVLRKAMFGAFDAACPHETPRQIEAYVQTKRFLSIRENKDAPAA